MKHTCIYSRTEVFEDFKKDTKGIGRNRERVGCFLFINLEWKIWGKLIKSINEIVKQKEGKNGIESYMSLHSHLLLLLYYIFY